MFLFCFVYTAIEMAATTELAYPPTKTASQLGEDAKQYDLLFSVKRLEKDVCKLTSVWGNSPDMCRIQRVFRVDMPFCEPPPAESDSSSSDDDDNDDNGGVGIPEAKAVPAPKPKENIVLQFTPNAHPFCGWEELVDADNIDYGEFPWKLPLALISRPTKTIQMLFTPVKGGITKRMLCTPTNTTGSGYLGSIFGDLMSPKDIFGEETSSEFDPRRRNPLMMVRKTTLLSASLLNPVDSIAIRPAGGVDLKTTSPLYMDTPTSATTISVAKRGVGGWTVIPIGGVALTGDKCSRVVLQRTEDEQIINPWFSRMAMNQRTRDFVRYSVPIEGGVKGRALPRLMIVPAPPPAGCDEDELKAYLSELKANPDMWLATWIILSNTPLFNLTLTNMLSYSGLSPLRMYLLGRTRQTELPDKLSINMEFYTTEDQPTTSKLVVVYDDFMDVWNALLRTVPRKHLLTSVNYLGLEAMYLTDIETAQARVRYNAAALDTAVATAQFVVEFDIQTWGNDNSLALYDDGGDTKIQPSSARISSSVPTIGGHAMPAPASMTSPAAPTAHMVMATPASKVDMRIAGKPRHMTAGGW